MICFDVLFICQVMGESYDFLGSCVVCYFCYYIDGKYYVWLCGNFCDEDSRLCQMVKYQVFYEVFFDKFVIIDFFKSVIVFKFCSLKF